MINTNEINNKEIWEVIAEGFFPSMGPVPIESVKGKDSYTWEIVDQFGEFVARLKDEVVMIDVDDMKSAELILNLISSLGVKCIVAESRTKGMHFYFRNAGIINGGTKKWLAVGLEADIKVGHTCALTPVKVNGEYRTIVRNADELDQIPSFLKPIQCKQNPIDDAARNDSLYKHICRLKTAGYAAEDIIFIANTINTKLFSKALDQKEMDTLLKEDNLKKEVTQNQFENMTGAHPVADSWFSEGKEKRFMHEIFGQYLLTRFNIFKTNKRLFGYKDGIYQELDLETLGALCREVMLSITSARVTEVLAFVAAMAKKIDFDDITRDYGDWIAFNNCIVNIMTLEQRDFTKDIIIFNKYAANYTQNESGKEIWTQYITSLTDGNEEKIRLMQEYMGYCLSRRTNFQKFMLFRGPAGNGKSTLMEMFQGVVGKDSYTAIDIAHLADKFRTHSIFMKSVAVADDIKADFIKDPSLLKKVVTGNEFQAEKKGENVFEFKPYCKIFSTCNNIPRFPASEVEPMKQRLLILELTGNFRNTEREDKDMPQKLAQTDVKEYIARWALEGYQRLIKQNGFSKCVESEALLEEYCEDIDPVKAWINEEGVDNIAGLTNKEAYSAYTIFCKENNYCPLSSITFSKSLISKGFSLKRRSRDGKEVKVLQFDK